MATAYIDRVDTLSSVERLGIIRSMTRKARVLFTPAEVPRNVGQNPYTILQMALDLMPDPLTDLSDEGFEALVLVERSPQLAENEPTCVDVTLKYDHLLDGPNQWLRDPPRGTLFGKGRCSITEKTTNFYYPNGDHSKPRVQILTAHTFPKWDMGVAGQVLNPALPFTIIQGGDVSIPFPQGNFQLQGVMLTNNPWSTAYKFIAGINKSVWLGQPPYTWICSEVQWDVIDPVALLYRFGFEFQNNIDTWNPTVAFNDQRTGRPPASAMFATKRDGNNVLSLTSNPINGADQPAGVWNVPALRPVDFAQLFQALFEANNPAIIE